MATIIRYCMVEVAGSRTREYKSLGMTDDKGREIGAVVETHLIQCERREFTDGYHWGSESPEWNGVKIRVDIQTARDGFAFGAAQRGKLFDSDAEVAAYVAKRIDGIRTRYEKMAAGRA